MYPRPQPPSLPAIPRTRDIQLLPTHSLICNPLSTSTVEQISQSPHTHYSVHNENEVASHCTRRWALDLRRNETKRDDCHRSSSRVGTGTGTATAVVLIRDRDRGRKRRRGGRRRRRRRRDGTGTGIGIGIGCKVARSRGARGARGKKEGRRG
jgi:hypothetical protein